MKLAVTFGILLLLSGAYEFEGVAAATSTNLKYYSSAQDVLITVYLVNEGGGPANVTTFSGCAFSFEIASTSGASVYTLSKHVSCAEFVQHFVVQPGMILSGLFLWDHFSYEGAPVGPGSYVVRGTFAGEVDRSQVTLESTTTISIYGGTATGLNPSATQSYASTTGTLASADMSSTAALSNRSETAPSSYSGAAYGILLPVALAAVFAALAGGMVLLRRPRRAQGRLPGTQGE